MDRQDEGDATAVISTRLHGSLIGLVLILVLSLRVVAAPFIMASPAPGIMAICSGAEIVYISMKDGQPVEDTGEFDAEPCPFFGIMSMLDGAYPPEIAPVSLTVLEARPIVGLSLPAETSTRVYLSRAPPARA